MFSRSVFILSLFLGLTDFIFAQHPMLRAENGLVQIKSEAPLELIKAESKAMRGLIDPSTNSFAFSVRVNSFEGFNSELQQTHFMENYLEQKKYPQATFKGKFIEDIPFDIAGTYAVRAKGAMDIHGVVKERIIRGTLTIHNGSARIQAHFLVPVNDHGITIPKIVMQKIAEEIDVNIDMEFKAEKPE